MGKNILKKKVIAVIYGNCVAQALAGILRKRIEFDRMFDITYIRSFKHPTEGCTAIPLDKIKKCSLFFFQRGHLQYPEFYEKLPKNCRIISFPILQFKRLWPFDRVDPRNKPEPEKGFLFGKYPRGDSLVMKLLRKGLTADQVFKKYMSTNIHELKNIDQIHEQETQGGRELDTKCDLPIYRYIEKNFIKERLFWLPLHPAPELLVMQTNHLLTSVGMNELDENVKSKICKSPPLSNLHLPIHPQVIDYFNLEWADKDTKYRYYDKGWFSFEEYLRRYIEFK
ncbi:MAG: hypothetical protein KAT34_10800 [Candidatus Aminicenantes bacterium]|nr:hypothetical protein [Candidatus Aminicenantes bacterium]